jgi:hypothetical protein
MIDPTKSVSGSASVPAATKPAGYMDRTTS